MQAITLRLSIPGASRCHSLSQLGKWASKVARPAMTMFLDIQATMKARK